MAESDDQGFATEESGQGLADSPEETVPDAPSEKEPDEGPVPDEDAD